MTHLECSLCQKRFEAGKPHNLCDCGGALLARYDLAALRRTWTPEAPARGPKTMWRYAPVLPLVNGSPSITLGEGMTPLVSAERFGRRAGGDDLWVKDEGLNPTGSFKARGLSCAVSMALALGIRDIALPSAGNAASALAAYAAAAGIQAHLFMPRDVPQSNYVACKAYGAQVTLVDGQFDECAERVAEGVRAHGWFNMAGLCEPYRLEGKKTMGYEVAEQFGWRLPDAILYPTGGGVGVIAMWKAFAEMEALGWISSARPKMIVVQAAGCQPLVHAWEQGARHSEFWQNAHTVAAGLRIPRPIGDVLVLDIVRRSRGTSIAVTDDELLAAGIQLASDEGIFAAPEGAACAAALPKLIASGFLRQDEKIVVFNTGSGLKYIETYATRFPAASLGEHDKLGGLITPR